MSENVTRISYNDKEIILIATAHVSQESADLVKEVIETERPSSVCIELDDGRYQNMQNPKSWEETNVTEVIKSKRVWFLLVNLVLSSYQKRMAKNLGTKVGGEMLQGIESAKAVGAEIVMADRSIQTTFLRIWRGLGFAEKIKLLTGIIFDDDDSELTDEDIQKMMQKDMLQQIMAEMEGQFPVVGEVLVHERDQYLANKIKNAPGPKVVAVLGGAHVPGVSQEIFRDQQMEKISQVPPKKKSSKAVGWIIPAIILGLIIYGFAGSLDTGLQQLSSWVLWNGSLAALFTALCFGHPLSIITAFVVAPISSLNPFLACGYFAALVEAAIRKPTVRDIQHAGEDIGSFKTLVKNRFLRILLVFIMANLGSSIGTFIAGGNMIGNLF